MVPQAIKVKYCYSFDYFETMKPKIGTHMGNRSQSYEFCYHNHDVIMTSYDLDRTHYE